MDSPEPLSPDQIKSEVQSLKAWTIACPDVPNIEDEDWLETFFRNCKYRPEKTKRKLESYYALKDEHPKILKNRDPNAAGLLRARRAITVAISDRLTNDGTLLIYHKYEPDPSLLDVGDYFKRIIMIHDVILLERLAQTGCSFVVDFGNFRYQHFLKIMSRFRPLVQILVNSYAEKINAAHLISSSEMVRHLIEFSRMLTPKKISERIQIHVLKRSDVHLHIDPDVLSSDFGGQGLSLTELEGKLSLFSSKKL